MNLKPEELVKALRYCSNDYPCKTCPVELQKDESTCIGVLFKHCIDQIERDQNEMAELREENERLTAENAKAEAERDALTEQIKERHDCMNCKHNDFCDFDSYTVLDCMNCVQEGCPCAGCFDSSRWEWRGLPEASEVE